MDEAALQRLLDRQAIEDTLYKYAATIDLKDYDGLRTRVHRRRDRAVRRRSGDPRRRHARRRGSAR